MRLETRLARLEAQARAPEREADPRSTAALMVLGDETIEALAGWADRDDGTVTDREQQAMQAYELAYEAAQ